MRKTLLAVLLFIIILFLVDMPVYAADTIIDFGDIWMEYDMDEIKHNLNEIVPEYDLDLQEVLQQIMKGKIGEAIKLLWEGVKGKLLSEVSS